MSVFDFVKDEFPVPCQHPSCALIHQRFFTPAIDNTPYWETVELPNGDQRQVRVTGFHEVTRTQWLVLLNGEPYGDPYDTKREAKAEAERLNARRGERMNVHVIGPNLRDQSKGDFHVHAEGCGDVKRSRDYAGPEYQFDRENTYDLDSPEAVSDFIYSDMIGEGSMTAADGLSSIHFFPCVNFGGQP